MSMIYFLVYVSSATTLFSRSDLEDILVKSNQNNSRLGVSGALLYKGGNLMQVLRATRAPYGRYTQGSAKTLGTMD